MVKLVKRKHGRFLKPISSQGFRFYGLIYFLSLSLSKNLLSFSMHFLDSLFCHLIFRFCTYNLLRILDEIKKHLVHAFLFFLFLHGKSRPHFQFLELAIRILLSRRSLRTLSCRVDLSPVVPLVSFLFEPYIML